MFGFLIGTACLIGLIATLRRGGRCHGSYGGGPWRSGGCSDDGGSRWGSRWGGREDAWGGGEDRWGGGRRGFGRWFMLRAVFERLDASPAQEKVIAAAFEELRDGASKAREEVKSTRRDVARAVRGPSFDATIVGEVFARHDATLEELRKSAIGAVGKVHEALDERQRERLADLIESGPGFGSGRRGYGGPYRADH